ncbi:hypothetical protein SLS53_002762 [Cytospora paraplurivora]|uniref:BTB domain-containing protein n=1 Tax=Cytospora paraplurivora TaxID=2898453 RepID=A0AAN9UKU1_9PEZI
MLRSGAGSDCVVLCQDIEIAVHKAFLMSRSGWFQQKLKEKNDKMGKTVIEVHSHSLSQMEFVLEFIYGAGKIEEFEHPSIKKSFMTSCSELYSLGRDFKVHNMERYAILCLQGYLSTKLKEICELPSSPADDGSVQGRDRFIRQLEDGINTAVCLRQSGDDLEEPYKVLVDFVVAGSEVLLLDKGLQWDISEDVIPATFVRDVLLAQYRGYQTKWMRKLLARPDLPPRRVKCHACGEIPKRGERAVFNPGSLRRIYTQICCGNCAEDEDKLDKDGLISWGVFKQE